ncbi:hypothetical protein HMPREF0496_1163 [Lentilactobacillus hilgardii ATCC 27305]|nr:hypothetical protein HMPREF0496_1163 [Lentilactobacillus hilgardii ATCC 27305]
MIEKWYLVMEHLNFVAFTRLELLVLIGHGILALDHEDACFLN